MGVFVRKHPYLFEKASFFKLDKLPKDPTKLLYLHAEFSR